MLKNKLLIKKLPLFSLPLPPPPPTPPRLSFLFSPSLPVRFRDRDSDPRWLGRTVARCEGRRRPPPHRPAPPLNFPSRPRARAQPKRNASTLNLTSPAYPSPSPSPSPNVALSWMRSARPARFFCNTRTYFSGGRPSPPHRPFLTFFSKTSVRPTSVRALVCSVVVRFFLLLGGLRPRELRDFGFPLFIY